MLGLCIIICFCGCIGYHRFKQTRLNITPSGDEMAMNKDHLKVNVRDSDSDEDNTSDADKDTTQQILHITANSCRNIGKSPNLVTIPRKNIIEDEDENKFKIDQDGNNKDKKDGILSRNFRSQTMIIQDMDDMDDMDEDEEEDKEMENVHELDLRNTALAVLDVTSSDLDKMNSLDEDNTKLEVIFAGMRSVDSEQSVRTPLTSDHDLSHKKSVIGFGYTEDSMYAFQGHEQSVGVGSGHFSHRIMHSDDLNMSMNMDVIGRNTSIIL